MTCKQVYVDCGLSEMGFGNSQVDGKVVTWWHVHNLSEHPGYIVWLSGGEKRSDGSAARTSLKNTIDPTLWRHSLSAPAKCAQDEAPFG